MQFVLAEKSKRVEGRQFFKWESSGTEGMKLSWVCKYVGVIECKL